MRNRPVRGVRGWTVPAAFGLILAGPAGSLAQQPARAPAANDAVAAEVRMLRVAIERGTLWSARVQLLAGRAALHAERLGRLATEADRLESDVSNARDERHRVETLLGELRQKLENDPEPAQRSELEEQVRQLTAHRRQTDSVMARMEARLARANQALEAERQRFDEADAKLTDLEREMERAAAR